MCAMENRKWFQIKVVVLFCLKTIFSHDTVHDGLKYGDASHDFKYETNEHRAYEKSVLLGEEEEGAGYDGLTREQKVDRLL